MAARGKELYQRGEIWWYRFTNPRTAAQERGSAKTSDKQLAQQRLDEAKANAWVQASEHKKSAQDEPKLWIEATTKWMQTKRLKRSIGTDIERINVIAPILDEIPLSEINDDLIHKKIVMGICKQRYHAPATINRYLDLIRSILNASVKWQYLDRAPSLEKPGQAGERARKAWINLDQYTRAQKAMSPLHANLMTLSLCTGMRVDNLLTLHPSEVDIPNKRIFIPAIKFKGKVDHTVPLNKTAIKILEKQLSDLKDQKDNVFTYRGKPIKRINLRVWHKVFDDLGINEELRSAGLLSQEKNGEGDYSERFVFHGMRHTFATWLGRTGVPIEIIASIGGWSKGSKNKMVNIYTHMDDVSHLLPYVRHIDLILLGKKKV